MILRYFLSAKNVRFTVTLTLLNRAVHANLTQTQNDPPNHKNCLLSSFEARRNSTTIHKQASCVDRENDRHNNKNY